MYRGLIIDDEKIVRLALRNIIGWEEMGIELVGEARDGKEALGMIEESDVDIVITDLKMPNMDGIQLIQELKSRKYQGKILVLSNYDDFELVKKALQLGVMDYILKVTMKVSQLKEAINRMVTLLDKDKRNRAKNIDEKIQVRRAEKMYKDKILQSILLEKPVSLQRLKEKVLEANINLSIEMNQVFYIQLDSLDEAIVCQKIKDIQLLSFSIKNIISDIINRRYEGEIVDISTREFVLIIPLQNEEECEPLAKKIMHMLNMYINLSVSIVIANGELAKLFDIVKECRKYVSCKFYHGSNSIFLLERPPITYEILLDYEKVLMQIKSFIYNKEWDNILDIFMTMITKGNDMNVLPSIIKKNCIVFMDYILNILPNKTIVVKSELEDELNKAEFMDNYINIIKDSLNSLEQDYDKKVDNQDRIIKKIEQYIIANINKKITLNRVAEYVHLNPSYLSRIFKKNKGISLIEYSNKIKIDKAKELLYDNEISIGQVGRAIGISDPYYFNKVFKKYAGISPSIYKNNK